MFYFSYCRLLLPSCQKHDWGRGEGGSIIIVLDEDGNVEITFSLCYNWVGYFYGGSISCPAPWFFAAGVALLYIEVVFLLMS